MKIIYSSKWLSNCIGLALKQGCFQVSVKDDGFDFYDGSRNKIDCSSGSNWKGRNGLELFYMDVIQFKQIYDSLREMPEQPITLELVNLHGEDGVKIRLLDCVLEFEPYIKP